MPWLWCGEGGEWPLLREWGRETLGEPDILKSYCSSSEVAAGATMGKLHIFDPIWKISAVNCLKRLEKSQ